MEIRQRFYYKKNADGTKTKVPYYPVTSAKAVVTEGKGTLKDVIDKIPSIEANQTTVNEIKEVMKTLGDGQAVSAQMAWNAEATGTMRTMAQQLADIKSVTRVLIPSNNICRKGCECCQDD